MTDQDDDEAFIQLGDDAPMSRSAFMLHGSAIVQSIQDGSPGWISDDYLSNIAAETTIVTLELETLGLWSREGVGYRIHDSEIIGQTKEFDDRLKRTMKECADRGYHDVKTKNGQSYCKHCLAPL